MPLSPLLAEALSPVEAADESEVDEEAAGADAAAASPAADGAEAPVAAEVPSDASLAAEGDEAVLAAAGAEAVLADEAVDALLVPEVSPAEPVDAAEPGEAPVDESDEDGLPGLLAGLESVEESEPGVEDAGALLVEDGAEDAVEAVPGDEALDVAWLAEPGALDVLPSVLLVESPQPSPVLSLLVLPRSTPVLLLLCGDVEVEVEVVPC